MSLYAGIIQVIMSSEREKDIMNPSDGRLDAETVVIPDVLVKMVSIEKPLRLMVASLSAAGGPGSSLAETVIAMPMRMQACNQGLLTDVDDMHGREWRGMMRFDSHTKPSLDGSLDGSLDESSSPFDIPSRRAMSPRVPSTYHRGER